MRSSGPEDSCFQGVQPDRELQARPSRDFLSSVTRLAALRAPSETNDVSDAQTYNVASYAPESLLAPAMPTGNSVVRTVALARISPANIVMQISAVAAILPLGFKRAVTSSPKLSKIIEKLIRSPKILTSVLTNRNPSYPSNSTRKSNCRGCEKIHPVGDDAVGAQVDQALGRPVVVHGVT